MRITPALLVLAIAARAHAQLLNPEFVYLRDYTFERDTVTREVHDAEDNGIIRLVAYVYKPVKTDRHQVVLWSHGSTAGLSRAPGEPLDAPHPAIIRYFLSRGYTLVAPMRRGRGESSGTYVEECSIYARLCTVDGQLQRGDRALHEALLDSYAVIDQLVYGRLAPRDSKIVFAGHSRGGYLSLVLAGERASQAAGVVNFSGGWQGANDNVPAEEFRRRVYVQTGQLTRAAKQATVPTIWIYADRDPFYNEALRQALLSAWRDAGGRAEYLFIAEHTLPTGHGTPQGVTYWRAKVDEYMQGIER